MENNVNNIQEAQTYMDNAQTKKIQKKKAAIARIGGGPGGEFWVVTDPHGSFAYRLYLPPPPFSKLVTVKVSQELYIIRRQNVGYKGMQLELQIYGEEGNNHEIGKLVNWQQLVLVRAPVDMGPPQIRDLLLQQVRNMQYQQFTPREVTQAFAIPPEIRAAIGREAPALVAQLDNQAIDGNPIDRNRRQNVARPGRYRN